MQDVLIMPATPPERDWAAALLVVAAMVTVFRFRLGTLTVLGASAAAGLALGVAGLT